MNSFKAPVPEFENRVRHSFSLQTVMATIGARLVRVEPGEIEIEMAFRPDLSQQHGYLHAGIVTTIVDSACGYAAMTLTPPGCEVLTAEYKINFLAPAAGTRIRGVGRVVRAGKTLTVCSGEAFAITDGGETPIATMLTTMFVLRGRSE